MKEHEKKEMERLEELRKTIEASPLTQQIIAEKAAAIPATRQEATGKIEALQKERDTVIPKLQADMEKEEAKYLKTNDVLNASTEEWRTARATLSSESQSFDSAISRQEQILIESADPLIDETIQFFRDKLDYLRSPGRISRIAGESEKNIITETKTVKEETNENVINSALQYCLAAIKELERMKLTPALDMEKIERMKAGIPSIDVYTEYQGEKPMKK